MKYFLDTNIFLRFLINDEPKSHEACSALFLLIEQKKIRAATSSLVFAEIVWVLQSFYQFEKRKVSAALNAFIALGLSFEDAADIRTATGLFAANTVKFVDAVLASPEFMQKGRMGMVSYDKDFDRLGVKRIEPQDIVAKF